MSQTFNIPAENLAAFKQKVYAFANGFDACICLDNNSSTNACGYHNYEMVAGWGAKAVLKIERPGNAFQQLKQFHAQHKGWLLGYFSYDLKNEVEKLQSANADGLGFPALYFFVPQHLLLIKNTAIEIISDEPEKVFAAISDLKVPESVSPQAQVHFMPRTDKDAYIDKVNKIRQHIEEGDVYEMNLCMEFFAEQAQIDPLHTYLKLLGISPTPFAAYVKHDALYALCASPERFLKKEGNNLTSQPIKGTAKRGASPSEDEALKNALQNSEKERAENVMIVDLVRNDLARSAVAGTVNVKELFGIYTFPQLHQMISTITAQMKGGIHWADAIAAAIPMGSMTGAPKVKAMELIEHYEESRRGLFSGAIGYITPDGDFDFNVVIRSLLYNAETQYLSYHVGGAITYDSIPEEEYAECTLKASAINRLW